jgi:hypothetical protein
MANFYPYLASSLPTLSFGMKAPFSFEDFLEKCRGSIPGEDFEILAHLPLPDEYGRVNIKNKSVKKWVDFDIALRDELAHIRASRKHIDPSVHIRKDGFPASLLSQTAMSAWRSASILEAEKFLDQARWEALEELGLGHFFNLDFILLYAYKLMILERWNKIIA